jgi:ABC-type multidrug transport system ATPase subunit
VIGCVDPARKDDHMETTTPTLQARDLALRTRRGPVYGPIDLTVDAGTFVVLSGAAGSGKTALLLTLAGRMRPTAGSLRVDGVDAIRHPAAARSRSALALFPGLNDLPGALRVKDAIASEAQLCRISGAASRVVAGTLPDSLADAAETPVDDLNALQRSVLAVTLALLASPAVLVVDDIGDGLTGAEQRAFCLELRDAADRGITVVGGCVDPVNVTGADLIVSLPTSDRIEVPRALAHTR